MQVYAKGNVYVDSNLISRTVNNSSEKPSFADDLMPATLAGIPILLIVMLLSLSGQAILLRSIIQEGNGLGLIVMLVPLFLPTVAASLIFFSRSRGWIRCGTRTANKAAIGVAAGFGLFVPITYLGLQVGAFMRALSWIEFRRRATRRLKVINFVTVSLAAILVVAGGLVGFAAPRYSLSRITVGRVLDGLTRINVRSPGKRGSFDRSVLVISVNDSYAIVASTGYPPKVESMPPGDLSDGQICQLRSRWYQRSIIELVGDRFPARQSTSSEVTVCTSN